MTDSLCAMQDSPYQVRVPAKQLQQQMRFNMKSTLKVVLPAIGVAALLVSPAIAKSNARHHNTVHHSAATASVYVPSNAYGYTAPTQQTISERWRATHSGSWDATHDPRENAEY
jgi:hypothetical protein